MNTQTPSSPEQEPEVELKSAGGICRAIGRIIEQRRIKASESQYDVMVCIRSVEAAQKVIDEIPVEGRPLEYGRKVQKALDALCETYWDSDGEYTSKGMVGDVSLDVYQLLDQQCALRHRDLDKQEASFIIWREMDKLVASVKTPSPMLNKAGVRSRAEGSSGAVYYIEFTFENASSTYASVSGKIYSDEFYECPIETASGEIVPKTG